MDTHLAAMLYREAGQLLSSTSLGIKTYSSDKVGWTSVLMWGIAVASISGLMSWCVSWLLGLIFGSLLSAVIGVMLWSILGIALYDLISIQLIASQQIIQGATLKELELQGIVQTRYRSHKLIWSALNDEFRSMLMSSQESGIDHLTSLENELEHLTRLTGDLR